MSNSDGKSEDEKTTETVVHLSETEMPGRERRKTHSLLAQSE